MNYEIVELEECAIAGITARTNNQDPNMGMVIGGLWEQFYEQGIYVSIPDKKDGKALGIYTDYAGEEQGDYTAMVACRVEKDVQVPANVVKRMIPAGTYAKFIIRGDMKQAVIKFWEELWKMDLPRSFVFDFEEYQNEDMEDAEIHMYIGLKMTSTK